MTPQRDIVRIYHYKKKILHNVYYNTADNEFLIPLIETANRIEHGPKEWKTDHNNIRYIIFHHTILKNLYAFMNRNGYRIKKKMIKDNIDLDEIFLMIMNL
jgi:hypothetical protein